MSVSGLRQGAGPGTGTFSKNKSHYTVTLHGKLYLGADFLRIPSPAMAHAHPHPATSQRPGANKYIIYIYRLGGLPPKVSIEKRKIKKV